MNIYRRNKTITAHSIRTDIIIALIEAVIVEINQLIK